MEKDLRNIVLLIPQRIKNLFNLGRTYLVGGAIRDFLLQKAFFDFDFVIPKDEFAFVSAKLENENLKYILLNREMFPLYRVFLDHFTFDFTYYEDIESDVQKRDFTINAIYLNLGNLEIISHPSSFDDIKNGLLRVCSGNSIKDDPVRFMRAFRFLSQYQLKIEENTKNIIKDSKDLYFGVKRERARVELLKFLKNNTDNIKNALMQVFDDFDFSFASRIRYGENLPELQKNLNKDSKYIDLLKAYFLRCKYPQFLFGLTEKELEYIKFMDVMVGADFKSLFEAFYRKKNKFEFLLLNIVANFDEEEIKKYIEVVRAWRKTKIKFSEVEMFARVNNISISDAYKEVLKGEFKKIYENICHS
ncbi:tRNA nucleotidyltransferase/poly(A) polymerase family protein [Caldisericum exile]|uniref:CC-adding enzyme n=1 Tax=Caldisericum exile (strain DSM 21853 / NBRC 104410 / AZM16c01) TaxID=511051 RepID=A0A7U6GDZ5_CALEA|nr:CCA tRNA nucleotidyltransferase [Caldisericum exile]BAL80611.1 putative CC-adding enzyme [Caldisericum exile AZM16c01]